MNSTGTRPLAILLLCATAILAKPKLNGCPGNKLVLEDTCVRKCPDQFIETTRNGFPQCYLCPLINFLIPNKKKTECVCADSFFFNEQTKLCQPCHRSCGSCYGPDQTECLTCNKRAHRQFNGGLCSCSQGYWDDKSFGSFKCQKCHPDCLTCSGPEETDCVACAEGKQFDAEGNCVCRENFYPNDKGICKCPQPFYLDQAGDCINDSNLCGVNEQKVGENIKTNKKGNVRKVVPICECLPGFNIVKKVCVQCGKNEEYNAKKKKCQCIKEAVKFKGECVVCGSDQKFKRQTGECECKKKREEKNELGVCVSCPKNERYQNGGCVCNPNFFRNKNGKCRRCTQKRDDPTCKDIADILVIVSDLQISDIQVVA